MHEYFFLVYVNFDDGACIDLDFEFGDTAVGLTALATRTYSIKVNQFSCDFENLAPEGCNQYFYGPGNGIIKSFAFSSGRHLASQNQNICFR